MTQETPVAPRAAAGAPRGPRPRRRLPWSLAPLLLAPALLWNCWNVPFFWLDDITQIQEEKLVQPETPFAEVWRPGAHKPWYEPLVILSWRADRAFWEPLLTPYLGDRAWPAGVRLANLYWHLLAGLALWLALRRLRAGEWLAGFVAAAFALHPCACESVCWAVERKNVLSGAFGLLALWLYFRAGSWRGYGLATLAFAAALLSKPTALGVFGIVGAWELLGRPRLGGAESSAWAGPGLTRREWRTGLRPAARLGPWLLLALAGLVANLATSSGNYAPLPGNSLLSVLLTDVVLLGHYVRTTFWPAGLSFYYELSPAVSLGDGRFWLALGGLGLALGATLKLARPADRRLAAFGWLWFLAGLSPALNLGVSLLDYQHDRFPYVAAPGVWLAAGLAARGLADRFAVFATPRARHWAAGGVGLLALLWAGLSFQRGRLFADCLYLLEDAARKQPHSSYARIQYGEDLYLVSKNLQALGRAQEAQNLRARVLRELQAGVAAPDFDRFLNPGAVHVQLAALYFGAGQPDLALEHCRRASGLPLSPRELVTLHQLQAILALRDGHPEQAAEHFGQALETQPGSPSLLLGQAQARLAWAEQLERAGAADAARARRAEARAALRAVPPQSEEYAEAQRLLAGMSGGGGK